MHKVFLIKITLFIQTIVFNNSQKKRIITIYTLRILGIHRYINKKDEQRKSVSVVVIRNGHIRCFKFACSTKTMRHP